MPEPFDSPALWSSSTRDEQFALLTTMRELPPTSPEWAGFMADVIDLPMEMLAAVQYAVRIRQWFRALCPLAALRNQAELKWARDVRDEELKSGAAKKLAKGA